ncbi:MAG: hypothetical protein QOJ45_1941 [Verrucomicrobiota bacterium]
MENRESIRDIFNLHVIRDDVTIQSRRELVTEFRISVQQKRIRIGGNKNVGAQFPFRVQDRSLDGGCLGRFPEVVGYLTVEEAKGIGSGKA